MNTNDANSDTTARLETTKVNLVPKSLPDAHKQATITVPLCANYGLRLPKLRADFIKFFKTSMKSQKEEWGEAFFEDFSKHFSRKIVDLRASILINICNQFLQSHRKLIIANLTYDGAIESKYTTIAGYKHGNHKFIFNINITGSPFSKLNLKEVANALYHETRHVEQFVLVTRFMLTRGQNPKDKKIIGLIIEAAKNAKDNDTVPDNTNGEVLINHRHAHCAAFLYASLFGDSDEEKNLYPDTDVYRVFKVPTKYYGKQRDELQKEQKDIEIKQNEIVNKIGDKVNKEVAPEWNKIKAKIQRNEISEAAGIGRIQAIQQEQLAIHTQTTYKEELDKNAAALDKHLTKYENNLFEEEDAYETARGILNEF